MRIPKRFRRHIYTILSGIVAGGISAILITSYDNGFGSDNQLNVAIAQGITVKVEPISKEQWNEFNEQKNQLLSSTITLRILKDIPELPKRLWEIPLKDHESWIVMNKTWFNATATLDASRIKSFIEDEIIPLIPAPINLSIIALPKDEEVRAEIEGEIKDGWLLDSLDAAKRVTKSVSFGLLTIDLPVREVKGKIINETGIDLGELKLISRGRSDFAGSVPERVFNINKALNEHLSNVIIAPGEAFSFNSALGDVVETYTGWKESLGIFNMEELKPTAGGGICQVSTTTYRAAVAAGLPIADQRNHSMYIKYYKEYGEGLDATVYVGSQDLVFQNNTPGYLFIVAYSDGTEAFVDIYGTDDGREVVLEGPYRKHDAPEDVVHPEGEKWRLGWQSIAWRQRITDAKGEEKINYITSHYTNEIPWNPTPMVEETQI